MADKEINLKDRDFILFSTQPRTGKSLYNKVNTVINLIKNSKDYKYFEEMKIDEKQSILIKILKILEE